VLRLAAATDRDPRDDDGIQCDIRQTELLFQCIDSELGLAKRRRKEIEVADFITVFQDSGVRSWFDWARVVSPEFTVTEIFSRSKSLLGQLETVWYTSPDGSLGDWRNQGHKRVLVEDAAQRVKFPSEQSSRYIYRLLMAMQAEPVPLRLVLPCYRTGSGSLLILDGNHRAVAAYQSESDVRLLIFAISGPDNPLVLPDLVHETSSDLSPEDWTTRCKEIEKNFKQRLKI
jgi:hypothetical protein